MSPGIAEVLRKYPIGKWRGGQQKIDHRELSASLAFWNVFVSRAISPRMQHQKLRRDHPYIILSINRAKPTNLGVLICRSLEYHITRAKQIVFPSTITALCQRAGVNVSMETDIFLRAATPLGARAFNKMALARGERPILDNVPISKIRQASRDAITVAPAPESGEMQNHLFIRLLEGQREIIGLLKRIDNRMSGGIYEGTIVTENTNANLNNNVAMNEHEVNAVDEVGNDGDENDALQSSADNEFETVHELGNINLDKNDGGISLDLVNEWTDVIALGAQAVNEISEHLEGQENDVRDESTLTETHQAVDLDVVRLNDAVAGSGGTKKTEIGASVIEDADHAAALTGVRCVKSDNRREECNLVNEEASNVDAGNEENDVAAANSDVKAV